MIHFDPEIVGVDIRAELKLFHLPGRGADVRVLFLLGFLVLEFPVLNNAADGRGGIGGDLNQIHAATLSQAERLVQRHDSERLLGFVKNPYFSGSNLSVSAVERFPGGERTE